jgi:hypothetical protein
LSSSGLFGAERIGEEVKSLLATAEELRSKVWRADEMDAQGEDSEMVRVLLGLHARDTSKRFAEAWLSLETCCLLGKGDKEFEEKVLGDIERGTAVLGKVQEGLKMRAHRTLKESPQDQMEEVLKGQALLSRQMRSLEAKFASEERQHRQMELRAKQEQEGHSPVPVGGPGLGAEELEDLRVLQEGMKRNDWQLFEITRWLDLLTKNQIEGIVIGGSKPIPANLGLESQVQNLIERVPEAEEDIKVVKHALKSLERMQQSLNSLIMETRSNMSKELKSVAEKDFEWLDLELKSMKDRVTSVEHDMKKSKKKVDANEVDTQLLSLRTLMNEASCWMETTGKETEEKI